MTIIVFLVDTSASMNQRAYLGGRPTLLDVAKNAVETFVKIRQRSQESRGDRYMLLTFEEPPSNIKAGWKENLATFYCELKNLQGSGMTTLGAALKNTFDVLNINRMQSGIDTYGQGRCPYYLEPSMLVVITDGGRLSTMSGIQEELNLPLQNPMPGSELTKEPFRWDQRLFSLVLRMSGTPPLERDPLSLVPNDHSPIDAMCEVTGGRSYAITSHRMLMQCIDSLVQKVQSGVVLNFEKIGPDPPAVSDAYRPERADGTNIPDIIDCDIKISDKENSLNSANENDCFKDGPLRHPATQNGALNSHPHTPSPVINANNTSWHCCRKLIYVPRASQKSFAVGFWPIPESFWPDLNAPTLPPRNAHPNVKFSCTSQEPMVIDNLPFDKYELEPSPLTQYILSRRQPNVCWQVFISNSYKTPDVSHPFGYLKASTNLQCVNLFVLPYNYPVLLPLLDDLFKVQRCKPSKDWKLQFDNYIRNMPSYYAGPLRKALQKMGAPNLVPENLENCLSYSVLNYLKRVKSQAKQEYERMCSEVGKVKNSIPDGIKVTPIHPLTKEVTTHPCLKDKFKHMKEQLNEFNGFLVRISDKELPTQSFRNPFDIPRKNLLDQIARMRANFLQPISRTRFQDEDQLHNLPVGQMGNYQDYLKRMQPPLREIESLPVRQHMFGNPFKIDKNSRMMVDETDIDLVSLKGNKRTIVDNIPLPPRLNKRKPGPLPWDITIRRPVTPNSCASVSSPVEPNPLPNSDISVTQSIICDTKSLVDTVHLDSDSGDEDSDVLEIDIDSCELVEDSSDKIKCEDDPMTNHVEEASVPIMMISQGVKQEFNPTSNNLLDLVPVDYSCSLPSSRSELEYDLHEIKEHNKVIKRSIFKQIRKPGKNFKPLFVLLDDIQGPVEVRSRLVSDVISEANRFKRKQLVVLLEGFMSSLSVKETSYNHRNNLTNGPS